MSTLVASILAEIGIDDKKFTAGKNGILGGLGDIIGGFGKLVGPAGIAATAIGFVVDYLNKAEQAAVESAKVDAKLEAVLRSTGGAAGMTSEKLNELAESLATASGLDDELVKNSEAVLLTFTKIGSEVFPQTMQAAADMAAVLGGDLQGTIIQVGKAMNDFSGYSALKRAGVSFTGEQLAQIKNFKETNDLIGYQNMLLKELQTEFGGAAEAITNAGDGAENMKVALENLKEEIGESLIPAKRAWNQAVTDGATAITNSVKKTNDYRDSLSRLGIVYDQHIGYLQNGKIVTTEYVNELLNGQAAQDAWSARLNAQADAYYKLHPELKAVTADYSALADEIVPTSAYMSELTSQLLFNQAAAGLDAEASLELARTMGLVDEKTAWVMDETQQLRDKLIAGEITIEQYTEYIRRLNEEYAKAQSKTVILTLDARRTEAFNSALQFMGSKDLASRSINTLQPIGGYANGADFIVPPGYPNDSYPMMVETGEHVKVTPADQAESGMAFDYNLMARAMVEAIALSGALSR